ncbi:MAG: sulfatase-like hydrolase/transferase [Deltaproteobacteria bacterium]|nr:sulfatase-like hydrolase/transferase [Deltaproteobacteria bacterium]
MSGSPLLNEVPPAAEAPTLHAAVAGALLGGALAGFTAGAVEAGDLFARRLAPAEGRVAFTLLTVLAEGGLAALCATLFALAVRVTGWRGHAVGHVLTAPVRGALGLDAPDRHAARAFAGAGGVLTGVAAFVAGVGALSAWSQKAFNARELAGALVGVLALGVLPVALALGAVVREALVHLPGVRGGSRRAGWGLWPWVALLAAGAVELLRVAQPVLKGTDLRPALYPVGLAAGAVLLSHVVQRVRHVPARVAAGALALSVLCAGAGLQQLPGSAPGGVVLERGMLSGPAVRWLRAHTDGDKDGFSSILGGGDCDDSRKDVFPGAVDRPDNGVDEDCSGADFHVPPRRPDVHHAALPDGVGPYKNILLVIVDTLRLDRMHLYGNPRPNTPYLDALAQRSAVFDANYCNGVRSHRSIPSILTGRYPSRLRMAPSRTELLTLLPQNVSLAERLTPRGYAAASFILEKYFEGQEGLTQGFDFFNPRRVDPAYNDWSRPQGEAVVNKAMEWINQQADRPWLAWVHLYDPHLYWHDTPFGGDPLARYDAAVAYVDRHLGRLVDHVQGLPDGGRTLMVFTSDHGQGLGTHGEWGHGQNLWQEDIHVPLLIHAPGFPAQRVSTVVENVDIVPTLLNLLGLTSGVDPMLDGKTLVPLLLRGDAAAAGDPGTAIVEGLTDPKQPHNRRAVVRGNMKLLLDLDVNTTQLIDVARDQAERNNLAGAQPELVTQLRNLLSVHNAVSAWELSR